MRSKRLPRALMLGAIVSACGGANPVAESPPSESGGDSALALPVAPKQLKLESGVEGVSKQAAAAPVMGPLQQQLQASMAELKKQDQPPYFMSYQVIDRHQVMITAQAGALLESSENRGRTLDVDLRVGDYARDNSHPLPGTEGQSTFKALRLLPLKDNGPALVNELWVATNEEYEQAREDLMHVRSSVQLQETEAQKSEDFSREAPAEYYEQPLVTSVDMGAWQERLQSLSALAAKYPELMHTSVGLEVLTETRYFVSSEGSRVQVSGRHVRLMMMAETLAGDGMPLSRFDAVDAHALESMPDDVALRGRFERVLSDLRALTQAPVVEPYVGPAILDGRAAGVFFHEVLGHRIEGHRQDAKSEGQTFAKMVGQPILQARLNVYDDPRLLKVNGVELNGFYRYDDEGVPAQRAELVRDRVLKGFLLSRAPTRGFTQSNGHGRRQPAHGVVARQANLVVDPLEPVSRETLKRALLDEVARQGLEYGLRFTEISGGFTQTQRYDTQAFKVMPVMVFRVYPDGREELVRGVDIEGTPLTALSKIVAAGNDFEVFNGACGAESGWVPVSATSPSILVSQLEVARQELLEERPPVLPAPGTSSARSGNANHGDSVQGAGSQQGGDKQ